MILTNIELHNSTRVQELNAKFEAIFPTWPTVVATILAILILLLVLTKLFYNPVKTMVLERQRFIQSNIDNAIKKNEEAIKDRKQATLAIIEANAIARSIVLDAEKKAEHIIQKGTSDANNEAKRLVEKAHKEVKREKVLFEMQAKKEIVTIALAAAKVVIKKEVDNASNKKLVNDFIAQHFAAKDKYDS